jgi:hypothetical protein
MGKPVTEIQSELSPVSAVDEQTTLQTQMPEAKPSRPEYKATTDCNFQRLLSTAQQAYRRSLLLDKLYC